MADSFLFLPLGGGGSGNVNGAASSVDGEIVLFDGATGKLIKSAAGTGVVHAVSGVYAVGSVLLGSEVSGVLPIANGGTNSSAALSSNRVMVSVLGSVVENAALTPSRALASGVSGLPTVSATTSTELGYVSGVTSLVQPQFDALTASVATKVTKVTSTDKAVVRFNGTTGDVQNSLVVISDVGAVSTPSSVSASSGVFSGPVSGTTGTFSSTVSGTTGTFSAGLSATTGAFSSSVSATNVTASGALIAQGSFQLPRLTTTQRNALTLLGGLIVYNTTTDRPQVYVAGTINAWVDMIGWGEVTS